MVVTISVRLGFLLTIDRSRPLIGLCNLTHQTIPEIIFIGSGAQHEDQTKVAVSCSFNRPKSVS